MMRALALSFLILGPALLASPARGEDALALTAQIAAIETRIGALTNQKEQKPGEAGELDQRIASLRQQRDELVAKKGKLTGEATTPRNEGESVEEKTPMELAKQDEALIQEKFASRRMPLPTVHFDLSEYSTDQREMIRIYGMPPNWIVVTGSAAEIQEEAPVRQEFWSYWNLYRMLSFENGTLITREDIDLSELVGDKTTRKIHPAVARRDFSLKQLSERLGMEPSSSTPVEDPLPGTQYQYACGVTAIYTKAGELLSLSVNSYSKGADQK